MANASQSNLNVQLNLSEVQLQLNRDEKRKLKAEMERVKAQSKKKDVKKELDDLTAKIAKCEKEEPKLLKEIDVLKHRIKNQLQKDLNIILQKIQLKNESQCKEVLNAVFPAIIERMRQADPLFKKMYKDKLFTGSYYEKLRIKDACEYDINIILDLPKTKAIKINASASKASQASLTLVGRVEDMQLGDAETRTLKNLLDDQNYILPNKVLGWIQSAMDLAQLKTIKANGVREIKFTAGGPARTLLVVLSDSAQTTISIDFVPVFRFPYADWPGNLKQLRTPIVNQTAATKRNLYLVPKCYKRGVKQSPHEPTEKEKPRVWRMHFAEVETGVLERNIHARPVIKLLKLLRDNQKWKGLHSYFLKTLVLNDIAAHPSKEWSQSSIPDRLIEMLEKLKVCLDKKTLPHFFFPTVNLLQYMNAAEMANISQRLDKIIKIRENPNLVTEFFKA